MNGEQTDWFIRQMQSAWALLAKGQMEEAHALTDECLRASRAQFGEENLQTALAVNTMASIETRLGHLDAAKPMIVKALATRKRIAGPKSSNIRKVSARWQSGIGWEGAFPMQGLSSTAP